METEPEKKESRFGNFMCCVICWIAIAIMFGGPLLVVCFGYKDILLYFLPKSIQTTAIVEAAKEGKPSKIFPKRGGDWYVNYRYEVDGAIYRAEDVVPPAIMDPDAETVTIRFFPPYPEISKINSQVSSTPLQALAIVLAVAFYWARDKWG